MLDQVIIAFRKELISWQQQSALGDKNAIIVQARNDDLIRVSNLLLKIESIMNKISSVN